MNYRKRKINRNRRAKVVGWRSWGRRQFTMMHWFRWGLSPRLVTEGDEEKGEDFVTLHLHFWMEFTSEAMS